MSSIKSLPSENLLAAYWIPTVGIGPDGEMQNVHVPMTEALNYQRPDGSPQVNVLNVFGATFTTAATFAPPYLDIDPILEAALNDGSVQRLQEAGISVVLSIVGNNGTYGWSNIPEESIADFVSYLDQVFVSGGYQLDGIDIDDEYYSGLGGPSLVPVVQAMRNVFGQNKIISKALFNDEDVIGQLAPYLTMGGIMSYGDYAQGLEQQFEYYVSLGMKASAMTIGVNAGPVAQGGSFTSVETAMELAAWQPAGGPKLGMMVWTFCQDIQQFTADPQNQPDKMYPNADDHLWQRSMVEAMVGVELQ
jgi:hypothetical protein